MNWTGDAFVQMAIEGMDDELLQETIHTVVGQFCKIDPLSEEIKMNDERKMILTMLAEGKVSAEEANLLLEALATSEAKLISAKPAYASPPKVSRTSPYCTNQVRWENHGSHAPPASPATSRHKVC